jgi:hypothetical protein
MQLDQVNPMSVKILAMLLGGTALLLAVAAGSPDVAMAQVNCETIPPGPARTDCYIGLSRIYRQKSEIAAGVARQKSDTAIFRNVTGDRTRKKGQRTVPAPQADWWISARPR